jgi:hypothetical protein
MTYSYCLDDLVRVLRRQAPTKADAFALHRRKSEHGLLSVGLKIHCLNGGEHFAGLVEGLGGSFKVLDLNSYKQARASICLVLPPVGSAGSAILLLECIEKFVGIDLFGNRNVQIQLCSPGRLDARRSALLAIGFYLGSDTLRRYDLGDLETSFSEHFHYPRGKRLVLYDADGDFDRDFAWWKGFGAVRLIEQQLPFNNGRSDLLAGSASRRDIENINLIATLLVHSQYQGYWGALGRQLEKAMEALLDRHLLTGLIDAPWVRTADPDTSDDQRFFSALQELMSYALDEATRMKAKAPGRVFRAWKEVGGGRPKSILQEVQLLVRKYREDLVGQSRLLAEGERR